MLPRCSALIVLFRGFAPVRLLLFPFTICAAAAERGWTARSGWCSASSRVNLLILMEVADRLSLKGDLEIARDIQLAMLPAGMQHAGDASSAA